MSDPPPPPMEDCQWPRLLSAHQPTPVRQARYDHHQTLTGNPSSFTPLTDHLSSPAIALIAHSSRHPLPSLPLLLMQPTNRPMKPPRGVLRVQPTTAHAANFSPNEAPARGAEGATNKDHQQRPLRTTRAWEAVPHRVYHGDVVCNAWRTPSGRSIALALHGRARRRPKHDTFA